MDPEAVLRKRKVRTEKSTSAQTKPKSPIFESILVTKSMEQQPQQQAEPQAQPQQTAVKQRMPLPDSRDAPKFRHNEPAEVQRFIQRMESLFEQAGITGDRERKRKREKLRVCQRRSGSPRASQQVRGG